MMIKFNKFQPIGNEIKYIKDTLSSGIISGGNNKYTDKCSAYIEELIGADRVLMTNSCTSALETCALLVGIKPGDEVIVPAFTYITSASSFSIFGAKVVFADVREDTLNIDESKIEKLITDKTKAIVVVHYGGVSCEMDEILKIAKKYNIFVIEDNAHGFLGTYKGKQLGTIGDFGCLSFHETKNFSCGEGGALIINNDKYLHKAECIIESGTDRRKFFRGEIDKYTWRITGSNYILSDLLSAVLLAQLEKHKFIQSNRQQICNLYEVTLENWCSDNNIKLQSIPDYCNPAYHIFCLLFKDAKSQYAFIDYMKKNGISATFHYQPLHKSKAGLEFGEVECPIAIDVSERIVRLPLYNTISIEEQEYIIQKCLEFK